MGLHVNLLPEDMRASDLEVYLRHHAMEAERTITSFSAGLVRGYRKLLDEFDQNRYVLIMVTDYMLKHPEQCPWSPPTVDERFLSRGMVIAAFHRVGGSDQLWRYMYFSRFRETWEEHRYFKYWIGVCDDARAALPGTSPSPLSEERWPDKFEQGVVKLEAAVTEIMVRMSDRGALEEWPNLPDEKRDVDLELFLEQRRGYKGLMKHGEV